MKDNQIFGIVGSIIKIKKNANVAISHTKPIESDAIRVLILILVLFGVEGVDAVMSFNVTPKSSAKVIKTKTSGKLSPLSHFEIALSE